jgi:hypothetical protein
MVRHQSEHDSLFIYECPENLKHSLRILLFFCNFQSKNTGSEVIILGMFFYVLSAIEKFKQKVLKSD